MRRSRGGNVPYFRRLIRTAALLAASFISLGQLSQTAAALTPAGPFIVVFATNSSEIDPRTLGSIAWAVAAWKGGSVWGFSISCYADRVGPQEYNMALSKRRCRTVRNALVDGGVPADRITTLAHGEQEPNLPTDDDVAEQANRVAVVEMLWVPLKQ